MKTKMFLLLIAAVLALPFNCKGLAMRPVATTNQCCGKIVTNFVPPFPSSPEPLFHPYVKTGEQKFWDTVQYYDNLDQYGTFRIGVVLILVYVLFLKKQNRKLFRKLAKYEPKQA